MAKKEEVWRAIPDWEGYYEASDLGRIRRSAGSPRCKEARILSPGIWGYGYEHVHLRKAGQKADYSVHRLVAAAFLGPIPEGMTVNHVGGNKANNCIDNLEVLTPRENYD